MNRKVKTKIKGFTVFDGAGVKLSRVLGRDTIQEFDPILMLDSFDSKNPNDYIAGFPMHPHRGIETISYLFKGNMIHKDSLGNEDKITDGEVQWMNSGSGILHEEKLPPSKDMIGVQLWLNLPKKAKMSKPSYNSIKKEKINEIPIKNGKIRLLAGSYKEYSGFKGDYLPLDYYDIQLEPNAELKLDTKYDDNIIIFTLKGDIYIDDELIEEKTAVKLTNGNFLNIKNKDKNANILYLNSKPLNEPVAWAGPIVMNTSEEIQKAFYELKTNSFIKENVNY